MRRQRYDRGEGILPSHSKNALPLSEELGSLILRLACCVPKPAVEVLRWQVLDDVLKVASWPLGFVILAAGDGNIFFWSESASWFVMAAFVKVWCR